ncbi:MAG: response regulator, partial [Thioalkalispiraceae bacterium]
MGNRVQLGFGIIIFLMIVSSGGVLYQTQYANSIVNELVVVSNAKIEYAQTMRNAIQYRVMSMSKMLTMDDPFRLDEEILRFHSYAAPYIVARQKLKSLPMTDEEKQLHAQLRQSAITSQPLSEKAVKMLREGKDINEVSVAMEAAEAARAPMYDTLDKLVMLQKKYSQEALAKSKQLYRETFLAIVILAMIVIGISLTIATYVSHTVAKKNRQLLRKNKELEIAYERAEAATKSKSAFLANMSHEIRTPITAIIGFAESSLLSSQTMEMRQKALNMIIKSSKHLLKVINDILDLSKVDANKLNVEIIATPLFEIIDEIEMIVRPLAEEKHLDFEVKKFYPLPVDIKTDPFRLKQIILNLCSNAVKFTEHGYVNIEMNYNQENEELDIKVIDSGIGLDKNQIDLIFEDFSQADATISRRFGGTGLGLSLSKNLAKALNVKLEVDAVPDEGSTFRVTMKTPATNLLEGDEKVNDNPKQDIVSKFKTMNLSGRILVVEDNLVNQQLLKLFLEKINVDITIVENGEQAIDKALSDDFDLVLMDMQMPVMDGLEATRILREDNNYTKPIVALTANVMKEDVKTYIEAGCNEYLSKPIETEKFFKVIARYLQPESAAETDTGAPIKS